VVDIINSEWVDEPVHLAAATVSAMRKLGGLLEWLYTASDRPQAAVRSLLAGGQVRSKKNFESW
jgi:hypothetical protein